MDPILLSAVSAVGTALAGAIGYLFREVMRLHAAETRCRSQLSQMQAEVWALNARLEQLSWTGADSPSAQIVVDGNTGTILEWNPGATILLHWTAREMLGKSISRIIPARFHKVHEEAFDRLRQTGGSPRRGPFGFQANTKEGNEIPVEVLLSGWAAGSQRLVGSVIRPRLPDHDSMTRENTHESADR